MNFSLDVMCQTILRKVNETGRGYIKLGFEGGRLVAANLYNNPTDEEKKILEIPAGFELRKELESATKNTFYGTLGFIFSDKKITNYYRAQTWKGSTLELFLRG